jgi:membrane-bound lytic murein transglycosylase B
VVGIVGVETYYGRMTGNFRVIDALATLSFDFPAGRRDRSAFFASQLEEYLLWCLDQGIDPVSVLGSYAGAIGLPQFMPGSINRWAVDFDDDGRIDLLRNAADVVGSVAHYMAAHGWQRDMPTTFDVIVPADTGSRATLLAPDIVPTFTAAQMQSLGVVLRGREARAHAGPLALVELSNGDKAPSYIAGTENFYVVTRYNWSSYYAMAVIELGHAVRAHRRRDREPPPSAPRAGRGTTAATMRTGATAR